MAQDEKIYELSQIFSGDTDVKVSFCYFDGASQLGGYSGPS